MPANTMQTINMMPQIVKSKVSFLMTERAAGGGGGGG